jgi:hypothetical protein
LTFDEREEKVWIWESWPMKGTNENTETSALLGARRRAGTVASTPTPLRMLGAAHE